MADREKIIECLEKAKLIIETWVPMFEQYNAPAGIDEAIALLKEQEAVEPTWQQGKAFCGSCGKRIPLKIGARYCHKCGRAVKWDG